MKPYSQMLDDSKDDEVVSRDGGGAGGGTAIEHYTTETISQSDTLRSGDFGVKNGHRDLQLRIPSEDHNMSTQGVMQSPDPITGY
jgi:hypothetical protein